MKDAATSLGYALLGLLHQKEQTGYGLQRFFEDSPMGIYSSSPGAIYPALKRLEKNGLIEGTLHETGPVQRSRVYRPTAQGTAALRVWLTRPISRREIEIGMDELMLRFAFLGLAGEAAPSATRDFLEDFEQEVDSYLGELEHVRTELAAKEAGFHPRQALEGGIQTYRAHLRWAREARTSFEQGGPDE